MVCCRLRILTVLPAVTRLTPPPMTSLSHSKCARPFPHRAALPLRGNAHLASSCCPTRPGPFPPLPTPRCPALHSAGHDRAPATT